MMKLAKRRRKPNGWKGLVAGLAGGLIASWTMNQYQTVWNQLRQKRKPSAAEKKKALDENVTVKAAQAVSETVLDRALKQSEKQSAGNAIHYVFGIVIASLYGLIVEYNPSFAKGMGLPFGTFVWIQADELAMPALGLSKAVSQYPFSTHLYALTSHLVYGFTTELVRRSMRTKM